MADEPELTTRLKTWADAHGYEWEEEPIDKRGFRRLIVHAPIKEVREVISGRQTD
jgi:hypothetical protein